MSEQTGNEARRLTFDTRALHAGQVHDPTTGAVMMPIYATSTYEHQSPGVHKGYDYSRTQNPTRFAFERCVADLEDGKAAFAFASGMAAISTVLELLDHGSHVIVCDDLYGGSYRLFEKIRRRTANLDFTYLDATDLVAMEAAIRPNTRMIWMESPSNPLLKLVDLPAVAALAKRRRLVTVIDNTFASPYCQRPLSMGFDISLHSITKYINGHSDVIGGVVAVGDNRALEEQVRFCKTPSAAFSICSILSCPARIENVGRANGAALQQRPAHRRMARNAIGRCQSDLSRFEESSPTRPGTASDGRLWRHDFGCGRRRPESLSAFPRIVPDLHSGRKSRRRREPDRASRPDDPCRNPAATTRGDRHRRRFGANLRRHRARRSPDCRSDQALRLSAEV